jgi:hypothetical protein
MSSRALSLICQINAIGELAATPETGHSAMELSAICGALKQAEMAVGARLARVLSFDPDTGRVA